MDNLGNKQIELKVHGLTLEEHGRVPARLFANKLRQLVDALEAADRIANGELAHEYVLASMHMSQPTAVLNEIPLTDEGKDSDSAIPIFNEAVEGIKTQDQRVQRLSAVVKRVGLLTSGVDQKFGFAEIRTGNDNIVRIDDFLRKRAIIARKDIAENWYNGAVMGSFDGVLDYVDARGVQPRIKLTLSAGEKEIDCIYQSDDFDALRDALHKRVRVYGRAIYASNSPLPMRVEVKDIEAIEGSQDFTKWRGSFRDFAIESWDGDA